MSPRQENPPVTSTSTSIRMAIRAFRTFTAFRASGAFRAFRVMRVVQGMRDMRFKHVLDAICTVRAGLVHFTDLVQSPQGFMQGNAQTTRPLLQEIVR